MEKLKKVQIVAIHQCMAHNFLLQISGSGLVAISGMFFNAKYSKLHIGNFTEERFIDIFKSETLL